MYERNDRNELVLRNRPESGYSVLSADQGQAEWVDLAGFAFAEGDKVEAEDFFDPSRSQSLDIALKPDDDESPLSVLFEQMFMTAYLILDTRTQKFSCKGFFFFFFPPRCAFLTLFSSVITRQASTPSDSNRCARENAIAAPVQVQMKKCAFFHSDAVVGVW